MAKYTSENGDFRFEKASETIVDLTDGYLSNKQNVEYVGGSTGFLGFEDENDDKNDLASRLLSTLSQIHSIITDHTIIDQEKRENLERLDRFTTLLSKLSDKYSNQDQIYAESFHDEVIDICQSINEAKENL